MIPFSLLAAADTVLVRAVPPVRTGFEQTLFVAAGLAQLLTPVVILLLTLLLYRMYRAQQRLNVQLAQLSTRVDPLIAGASSAVENVRALTEVVRKDTVIAADAIAEATGRMRDVVGGIADRVDDFGELLGRAYTKADAVADVAEAAVKTVKWGSRALRSRHDHRDRAEAPAPARTPARTPAAPPDEARDELAADEDDEHEDSPYATEQPEAPRPPRRRRRRGRGRRPPA